MEQIFVRPVPGRRVRDPGTMQPLAEAGELKPLTTYWIRRLSDGDVVEAKPQAAEPKARRKE